MSDTQPATIGDNLAPDDEALFDTLEARTNTCIENANRWANEIPEILDEEQAAAANDFLNQLRKLGTKETTKGQLRMARMAEQKPHTDNINEIQARYAPLTSAVEIAIKLIKRISDVWLDKKEEAKKKEDRRLAEEAREKREAAEKAAAEAESGEGDVVGNQMRAEEAQKDAIEADRIAKRAEKVRPSVASAYGGRATSQRRRTEVSISDVTKIPAKYLRLLCAQPYVIEQLVRAVKAEPSTFLGVPGIVITEERSV